MEKNKERDINTCPIPQFGLYRRCYPCDSCNAEGYPVRCFLSRYVETRLRFLKRITQGTLEIDEDGVKVRKVFLLKSYFRSCQV